MRNNKGRILLWILGWIFIFPLPLTILLIRKGMKRTVKYAVIAIAWILYIVIAVSISGSDGSQKNSMTSKTSSVTKAKDTVTETKDNIKAITVSDKEDVNLEVGQSDSSRYVKVDVRKKNSFTPEDIQFVSSNLEVATVSFANNSSTKLYYEITAINPGETVVFAKSKDGSVVSDSIKVTVIAPVEAQIIEIEGAVQEMIVDETLKLSANVIPAEAKDKSVTWTSSNESILMVDEDGKVIAKSGGTAEITVTCKNGVSESTEITVDGSKRLMKLNVTHSRENKDVDIGSEWSFTHEINGERISSEYVVVVGDTLNCYAKYTEEDKNPDIGEATTSYTVTEQDIINGFTVSMDLYVTENGGRNSGDSAHFIVTFTFSAK